VTRARDRNAALVVVVDHQRHWPEVPDVALQVLSSTWEGIGCGHGTCASAVPRWRSPVGATGVPPSATASASLRP